MNRLIIDQHGLVALRLYDRGHCVRMVESAKGIRKWEPARVSTEHDASSCGAVLTDARDALVLDSRYVPKLYSDFEAKVRSTISPLIHKIWSVDLPKVNGTQLIRYKPGGHYVSHKDSDDLEFANRYFTVLCYLNDDFEGGGTHFSSLSYSVKPASGKALIFPSQYSHAALTVTRGQKFAFLTWICGPVPIRWI